ncbi:hypothetical protein BC829DRAFT_400311 [Chytridium lagenaria]|nr:hypothetical protein BC829DRAFT_400311 [Chytridium lagenaria]
MTTTINYINTQQPASIDHLHFSPNTSLPSIHAIMDVDYHTDQQTQSPEGSDPTDTHESSLTLDSDSHPSSPTLSSTSAPLFGPKKDLHQISTPASSTTSTHHPSARHTPTFDFLDFQHHSPAFLAIGFKTHKFRQQDLAHRSNKWRTVDRHSGASTQLIVFQCKCGIPPKPQTGMSVQGRLRMYPYLRCKAFVHMTCDAEGSPLVVRACLHPPSYFTGTVSDSFVLSGFFTHTPACMDSTTLSTPRLNIDPKIRTSPSPNSSSTIPCVSSSPTMPVASKNFLKTMSARWPKPEPALFCCRSDVRNLRRVLLPEKRKREEEEEEEESMELDDEDDYTVSVKSESPTISPVVSKKRLKVTPTPSPAATTAPPSPTLPSPIDYPDPLTPHAVPIPLCFSTDHWTGVDVTNWREVVGI